jgi:hypothetical protein
VGSVGCMEYLIVSKCQCTTASMLCTGIPSRSVWKLFVMYESTVLNVHLHCRSSDDLHCHQLIAGQQSLAFERESRLFESVITGEISSSSPFERDIEKLRRAVLNDHGTWHGY